MKLRITFILFITVLCTTLSAQTHFTATYKIRFNDEFDRGRKDRAFEGLLQLSGNISRYYMVPKESFVPDDAHDNRFTPDTAHLVFTNHAEGTMLSSEFGLDGRSFFVSDSLYPMTWEITEETKKLDSLTCIKATCIFRGRNYIAWFAPDIPVPLGPWKMGGLPGLIVDLYDADENLVIQLSSLSPDSSPLSIPEKVKFSIDQYFRQLRAFTQKMQAGVKLDASGNCLTCTGHSSYQYYFWEKLPQ